MTHLDGEATADAQAAMDAEPSADRALLQELVAKTARNENKVLLDRIAALEQQLKESKNSPRGRQTGASNKKESRRPSKKEANTSTPGTKSRRSTKTKGQNQKAAGHANVTSKAFERGNNTRQQQKKRGRGNKSRTKRS